MNIVTDTIRDGIEVYLNKSIEKLTNDDLKCVKVLDIDRIGICDEILNVDYNELQYFDNLEELTISNCMIDSAFMDSIIKLKKLKKLSIYNCDFVDHIKNFFELLNIEELTIDSSLGINGIVFQNLERLTLRNTKINNFFKNIKTLDITHAELDINNFTSNNVKELIISEKDSKSIDELKLYVHKIIVVDDRMEIIKEVHND